MKSCAIPLAMTNKTIRRATIDDAEALSRISADTFGETFGHLYAPEDLDYHLATFSSVAYFTEALADPTVNLWVIDGDTPEHLIAYMKTGAVDLPIENPGPDSYELHRLYVVSSAKRQGLGRRLMDLFLREATEKGATKLYLGVYSENWPAQAFYRSFGFEKMGEYIYPVGNHEDLEFIFSRDWDGAAGTL